jgi:hypothetical protein
MLAFFGRLVQLLPSSEIGPEGVVLDLQRFNAFLLVG